ncbi:MAG: FhaA domain-containing protein [Motilibacteraceae bacterium]
MGVLQRFERRLEELVNRPFSKAFRAEVQPVEVASALQRELDDRAAIGRERTLVPNAFAVELGPHDYDRLSPYAEPVGAELSAMVREHAEEQGYSFVGPVGVDLELVEDLDTGIFRVRSAVQAGAVATAGPPTARTAAVRPWLEVNGQRFPLVGAVTVIGRGTDVDLRLDDPGVSRRHAEVLVTPDGAAQVRDLGSTNGLTVDGARSERSVLTEGSVLRLGSTELVFRTVGGPSDEPAGAGAR